MSEGEPLKIELAAPASLTLPDYNARAHTEEQVDALVEAFGEYGFRTPVVIDKAGVVVSGEGRVLAAIQMGMLEIPVVRAHHLTEAEARAFAIEDNRISEMGGWDEAAADRIMKELMDTVENLPVYDPDMRLPELPDRPDDEELSEAAALDSNGEADSAPAEAPPSVQPSVQPVGQKPRVAALAALLPGTPFPPQKAPGKQLVAAPLAGPKMLPCYCINCGAMFEVQI